MWFYVEGSSAALSTSLSFPVLLFGKVLEKKKDRNNFLEFYSAGWPPDRSSSTAQVWCLESSSVIHAQMWPQQGFKEELK